MTSGKEAHVLRLCGVQYVDAFRAVLPSDKRARQPKDSKLFAKGSRIDLKITAPARAIVHYREAYLPCSLNGVGSASLAVSG